MKIKLFFPPESIESIKQLGLRQVNPEILRWTTDHPSSSYGIGVLLRGKSGETLDGRSFQAIVKEFGAWIECDSKETKNRVDKALVAAATGIADSIRVAF